ncbi:hypothetical protein ACTHRK_16670 [Dietzia cercidiphylli]|uniref:hypothetical protein n=1 Tax=Dietzia cercidiphylli TaxID=498199 RepID=UPI003F7F9BBC
MNLTLAALLLLAAIAIAGTGAVQAVRAIHHGTDRVNVTIAQALLVAGTAIATVVAVWPALPAQATLRSVTW